MTKLIGETSPIQGVRKWPLTTFSDHRGSLTELLRVSKMERQITQVNWVASTSGTLRGVHLHFRHSDLVTMPIGRAIVGLHDCRNDSPTFAMSDEVLLEGADSVLVIPVGVAHGFWFPSGGCMIYGLDHEWDMSDEVGCHWDDPDLHLRWNRFGDGIPDENEGFPLVSSRDAAAGTLKEMVDKYASLSAPQSICD